MNLFELKLDKNYAVVNDINDFSMPYKIYGKLDESIMIERYKRLTNKPKSYLHRRGLW